jgi:O-methyltransferase
MNEKIKSILKVDDPTMNAIRLLNHYHFLLQVLEYEVEGDVVELGTYSGNSSRLIAAVMEFCESEKDFYLFDSFEGLPEFSKKDEGTWEMFHPGMFSYPKERLLENLSFFETKGRKIPIEGWFEDTVPEKLPEKICYAHLDGDLYESIKTSLEGVYPRLSKGAICVVDDYSLKGFPGCTLATDEFLADKPEEIRDMQVMDTFKGAVHAYFRKQ